MCLVLAELVFDVSCFSVWLIRDPVFGAPFQLLASIDFPMDVLQ